MTYLGIGLGLRATHYETILKDKPPVDWFEILTENYLVSGGKPLYYLDRIREHYPLAMHGVSLSLGGTDPLNHTYLHQVKTLMQRIQPQWVSDHLCWTGAHGINTHDLLPMPFTEEALHHMVNRIREVQDVLGEAILIENVSSYVHFADSDMTEWEFLTEVAQQADCFLLVDINNIYVNAFNHQFDAHTYLSHLPTARIKQIHLGGHRQMPHYIIDTHDAAVKDPVWELYARALSMWGNVSTIIEWDENIPALEVLLGEVERARIVKADYKAQLMNVDHSPPIATLQNSVK